MLNYSSDGQLRTLRYSFEKIRNVDDIAIRLIGGAAADGLISITVNPAVSCLEYNVAKLLPVSETDDLSKVKELAVILSDLKQVLDKLKGYHIDLRYVPKDLEGVFKEPVSGKTMFALIPCIEIFGDQPHPELLLVKEIVHAGIQQSPIDQDTVRRLENEMDQDTDAGHLIRNLVQILADAYPECNKLENRVVPKTLIFESKPVFEGIKSENDEKDVKMPEAVKAAAEEEILPMDTEIEAEYPDQEPEADQETEEVQKPEADQEAEEVQEPAEVEKAADTEPAQSEINIGSSPKNEEDELWMSNLKESIRAEILNEKAAKRNAYLIRRKKDEIIALSKDVFIIGKISEVCDYVIADNPAISRLHSIIRYNEATDEYSIIDCDTTNHTYLNGHRIPSEHAEILKDQMIIHMASEEFHFRR